ncbi:MAG: TIM barrel protein [Phycisphaeraceae bacterium]
MAIVTHGSDLSLAPTLRPLIQSAGGTLRAALDGLAARGIGPVQLDATVPGLRPRELDERARRDLTALIRRRGAYTAGLDVFIPRRHFIEPASVDRAMAAAVAAIELAADLGRLPVSLALPVGRLDAALREVLVEAADGRGVRLAVHAEDQLDALEHWLDDVDLPALGAGLDPAPLLARGGDPVQAAQRLAHHLAVARLSDVERMATDDEADGLRGEAVRCPVGSGSLDLPAYRVSVDLAQQRVGPVVLDLRGLANAFEAVGAAGRAWDDAGFEV